MIWLKYISIVLILWGCNPKASDEVKTIGNEKLLFSLKNNTSEDLFDLVVAVPDTILKFDQLLVSSQTEWIKVDSAYSYGFLKAFDSQDRKYVLQPIDFVGETAFKSGRLTFIINGLDSTNDRIDLDFSID